MNLKLRRLCERMARANRLNTRGLRSYRRQFAKAHKDQHSLVTQVVSGYAGKPLNAETRDAMLVDLMKALPPAPVMDYVQSVSVDADRKATFTLTPEFSALLRAQGYGDAES